MKKWLLCLLLGATNCGWLETTSKADAGSSAAPADSTLNQDLTPSIQEPPRKIEWNTDRTRSPIANDDPVTPTKEAIEKELSLWKCGKPCTSLKECNDDILTLSQTEVPKVSCNLLREDLRKYGCEVSLEESFIVTREVWIDSCHYIYSRLKNHYSPLPKP